MILNESIGITVTDPPYLINYRSNRRVKNEKFNYIQNDDVIDYEKVSSIKLKHPTEKPVDLLEIFIKNSSDENNIVFDGFTGKS